MSKTLFCRVLLFVLLVGCLPGCSDSGSSSATPAATPAWKTPVLIEADNTYGGYFPQVAMNASGNAVAIWLQDDSTNTNNVWSNRYSAATGLWGTPELIETYNTNGAAPKVAIDASGNAIAVWSHYDGARENIWANRYNATTGLWGTATLIESDSSGDASNAEIAMDASGNAVVVWYNFINARNMNDIWSNRYNASTGLWGTAELIETDDTGNAYGAQVAMDVSGNAVAVWSQKIGTRYNICSNRYNAATGLWGTAVLIETDDSGDANNASVAIDSSGNAVAVWTQSNGTTNNIWSNRYTATTGLWGTAVLIETDNTGGAYNPQVAMNASGNAVAVWNQSDGTINNIWSNRYIASTGLWGTAVLIETDNTGYAGEARVAVDVTGNAMAVWRQSDGTRENIWANRYTASTGLWGTATLVETDNSGYASHARVAMDATGKALVVWQQYAVTIMNVMSNTFK
jgi:predicted RNase H-like nuclease (RuvC/YqgF family)